MKERLGRLTAASERKWGTMTASQAVAHCAIGMEWAVGDKTPPRMLLGRLLGRAVKPMALKDDAPMKKNSPTSPELVVRDGPDFEAERGRLCGLLDRFAAGGAEGCTGHPHTFFGKMTPEEWAVLEYKHVDHHLRQFGV